MKTRAAPLPHWETPTHWLLRTLHLPTRWNDVIDAHRKPPTDILAQRRDWIIETLALFLSFSLVIVVPILRVFAGGYQTWSYYWNIGAVQSVLTYFVVLRGHSRVVSVAGIFTAIWLPALSQAEYRGHGVAITAMGCAYALMLAALTEPMRWNVLYAVMSVCSMLLSIHLSESHNPVSGPLTAFILVLGALALTGGRASWQIFHHLILSSEQNRALSEKLMQANTELERRVAERTQELADMAIRDELTGLFNRRHLRQELQSIRVQGRHCALLMVDVDHFKQVNDTLGHAMGDIVLQRVAHNLRVHLRDDDLVARVGGEEFVIVLVDCDLGTAVELAERLRTGIAQLTWDDIAAPGSVVTASVGVAAQPVVDEDDVNQLLRDADRALYRAKAAGRNRVVLHAAA